MPPKPKRTFLTNAQKLQLKQFWSEHPDLQLLTVVDWVREQFGVSVGRATLYRIYHAPVETFAGNAQQKKGRRVKFPALEKDILAFYEENRSSGINGGAALSDDALLRAATELRARHGISETELKLSNGWLHRFKERHALRGIPRTTGDEVTVAQMALDGVEPTQISSGKPTRKPRAPPRRKEAANPVVNAVVEDDNAVGDDGHAAELDEVAAMDISEASCSIPETLEADTGMIEFATPSGPGAIQPLTYISAVAVDTVAAVAFVRWKLNSGMAHDEFFSVDNDGVSILRYAKYRINVELQHTASVVPPSSVIFKVWAGVELLGRCEGSVRSDGDRTLSVLELECTLYAQTPIRVEYHAPGVVYSGSRLVLRMLSEFP